MEEPNEEIKKILVYINDTPELTSLLYDIDLLPEQTLGTDQEIKTLCIAHAWKGRNKPQ